MQAALNAERLAQLAACWVLGVVQSMPGCGPEHAAVLRIEECVQAALDAERLAQGLPPPQASLQTALGC